MSLKPCLDCGRPSSGSRCPPCKRRTDNARSSARGTTAERGLAGDHARMSRHYKDTNAACVCASPQCPHHEGVCGRQGTTDNPITAGHITPRSKGGTNEASNYQPECRRCNSSKGAA